MNTPRVPIPCRPARGVPAAALAIALLTAGTAAQASEAQKRSAADPADAAWRQRVDQHIASRREHTLAACGRRGIELPADFLAWIDADPVRRASVWGCRADPLPVLLALRSLELDLGVDLVRRDHTQLALAFAIQGSYQKARGPASPWNDGDVDGEGAALPDLAQRPPLVLTIPGDPRVRIDTKDPGRPRDRDDHIVDFLEDHAPIEVEVRTQELPPLEYDDKGVAKPRGKAVTVTRKVTRPPVAADVIASAALQAEFNSYMAAHGHADVRIDTGERVVHWYATEAVPDKAQRAAIAQAHELFHTAYRNKGRMPAERDRAPTAAESMAWFVRNARETLPGTGATARSWPLFPLQAPWPLLLMLAADDQPLREREDIWLRFRDHGEMKTYGEYIGGIAQQFDMQSARRLTPFAWSYGSIQMMWKDGGVCGTMGNIGARTWRICGVPASTAGQPGHCALVLMEHDAATGTYRCKGGQYATGGDEVTTVHAGWNLDDRGGRRPMVFWQTVAWGCSHDAAGYVDTLVMRRAFAALPATEQAAQWRALLAAGLRRNPFAIALVEASLAAVTDAAEALAVLDTFLAAVASTTDAKEHALYRSTVRDLAHARVRALPAPAGVDGARALLAQLEQQGCNDAGLLARTWRAIGGDEEFTRRCHELVRGYLATPERVKSQRPARDLTTRLDGLADTLPDRAARRSWAEALLPTFAGHEILALPRGKVIVDPAVALLCKLADRAAPTVPAGK